LFSGTAPRHAYMGELFHFKPHSPFSECVSTMTDKVIPLGFEVEINSGHLTYLVSGTFVPGLKRGTKRFKGQPGECFDNVGVRVRFKDGRIENIPRRAVATVVVQHATEIKRLAREFYEKTRNS